MDVIDGYRKYTNNTFKLSEFQEKACLSIAEDKHVLVTAHTGSGKTLPAEFSIYYNIKVKNKKVVYTAPIKALSNQKYNEFTKKFPDIEVGILTGDIKHNPSADLLIMTTEILQNHCFKSKNKGLYLDFNMDIDNELGSVVFDEVHYIDDPDRGTVWEQTMILLPDHVPFVMLSATIGQKEQFSNWISTITNKDVVICSSEARVVPLHFYEFFTLPDKYIKNMTNGPKKKMFVEKMNSKMNLLKSPQEYHYNHLNNTKKCLNEISKDNFRVHQKFVLNDCLDNLKNNDMFPCLLFVFSRKQVESIAKEIFVDLYLENEKDSMVKPIFTKMLVSKISNWKEYIALPECESYINLLEKGIGVHHAGMLPVFREIMEIMYEQRYIKVLVATETFAIGLNMPTRTVLFNSLYKHDGIQRRLLRSHEFIQMAGRAGRRNIDKIGYVILLTNNYDSLTETEYHSLFHSDPKVLTSKFRITYNLLLNYLETLTKGDFVSMIEKSLMNTDIISQINLSLKKIEEMSESRDKQFQSLTDHIEFFDHYESLKQQALRLGNNKKKKVMKEIRQYESDVIFSNYPQYQAYNENIEKIKTEKNTLFYAENYVKTQIDVLYKILQDNDYMTSENVPTIMGLNASYLHEIPCLPFSDLYLKYNKFENYTETELVSLLSCFYDLKVKDDYVINYPFTLKEEVKYLEERLNYYTDRELPYELCISSKFSLQYNLMEYISNWYTNIHTIDDTKFFFHKISNELDIFVGDFIKCCMKIVNICNELSVFCENDNNYCLLEKINNIKINLQKSIVSNRSLYV